MNKFFEKLPFRKLAEEKISAETRAKVPMLDKAIPFANHIICGLVAVLLVVAVVGCSKKNGGGGGGNINKVKNGVFPDYDNTITVGQALENNSGLKGGKWGTVKKDGREYVTYTIKYTGERLKNALPEEGDGYDFALWESFLGRLKMRSESFAEMNSMSSEEIQQIVKQGIKGGPTHAGETAYYKENPSLTVNTGEVVLSFVMNLDGTFGPNMIETYVDVTLLCFNNKKVRINSYGWDNNRTILNWIYNGFSIKILG